MLSTALALGFGRVHVGITLLLMETRWKRPLEGGMWGLAHHRGMFRVDGDSISAPFLHRQGFDLQEEPQTSALATAHETSWSLPFPPVCPRVWLESLALVNRQSFSIYPIFWRMPLPEFREALQG